MTGELAPRFLPDRIPGLGLSIGEAIAGFGGGDPFPLFVLLNDGAGGSAFLRWMDPDAELETLSHSTVKWPATLTVIAASGRAQCLQMQEHRLQ